MTVFVYSFIIETISIIKSTTYKKNDQYMFYLQEMLAGVVVVASKSDVVHQGITLTVDGSVNLQLSSKSVGLFEAFYNSLKVRRPIDKSDGL